MDWLWLGLLAVGGLTALSLVLMLTAPSKAHSHVDGDPADAADGDAGHLPSREQRSPEDAE